MAGIAAYVKALKPHIKVIGVEPTGGGRRERTLGLFGHWAQMDQRGGAPRAQLDGWGSCHGSMGTAEWMAPVSCCTACCVMPVCLHQATHVRRSLAL